MSIFNVSPEDVRGIQSALGIGSIAFTKRLVDFNVTNTDYPIAITLPTGYSRYRIVSTRISGASASLTTSTCSLYTGAGATGTAIIGSATAVTVSTAAENTNNNQQQFVITNQNTLSFNAATLYFRVQTPQGSAATANVTIIIEPLS